MKNFDLKLYAITDRRWLNGRSLSEAVRESLAGGVTILQLREKSLSDSEFYAEALEIKTICDEYGVPLIINDNLSVAQKLGCGLHVGQSDTAVAEARRVLGPDAVIGASCPTVAAAREAEAAGADYLGVGAVFSTSTKDDADVVSKELLSEICGSVGIPVVAIGGISAANASQLQGTGIAGISVISAIFAATDIKRAAEELSAFTWK